MGKGLINGYFVFENKVFDYLNDSDDCDFEFGISKKL